MKDPKLVIQREETPEMLFAAAIDGDAQARSLVLQGPLKNARVLKTKRKGGHDRETSLAAAGNFLRHGTELAAERGKTPMEAWASELYCPVDGSLLVNGQSIDLDLRYGKAERETLLTIRLLVAGDRFGSDPDDRADNAELVLASSGIPRGEAAADRKRFWHRCRDFVAAATPGDRAAAESWLDEGPSRPVAMSTDSLPPEAWPPVAMASVFAEMFQSEASARSLFSRAGEGDKWSRLRSFHSMTLEHWWTSVVREVENGMIVGGVATLLAAAREIYPHNPRFAAPVAVSSRNAP